MFAKLKVVVSDVLRRDFLTGISSIRPTGPAQLCWVCAGHGLSSWPELAFILTTHCSPGGEPEFLEGRPTSKRRKEEGIAEPRTSLCIHFYFY